jgi:hypothetical protein
VRKFSIVSVAFNDYDRFIEPFIKQCSKFTDDIIIETDRMPMGEMRNVACSKAKYDYIISLDIDDTLLDVPEPTADFVGLGWLERGEEKEYWLPGEKRSPDNTIRSNIMFSKNLWQANPFIQHDYYIYKFIQGAYNSGFSFEKSDTCVVYNREEGTLSSVDDPRRDDAKVMLKELMEATCK